MNRITSKSRLVEELTRWQILVLIIAVAGFGWWIHQCVHRIVRGQIMDENQLIAAQMASLIERDAESPFQFGDDSWEWVQRMVEDVRLPNDGYMCIIEADDGKLLCHPEIRDKPEMLQWQVGSTMMDVGENTASVREIAIAKRNAELPETGLVDTGSGLQVVSVAHLEKSGSILLVHQSESGVNRAMNQILWPIGIIGLVIGLSAILMNRKLSIALLDQYENELSKINAGLEDAVHERTESLMRTRDSVIFGLAKLSESRDNDTGDHLDRIRTYVVILARELADENPCIDETYINDIGLASSLHDIGKVGVPDSVLLSPLKLTPEERCLIEEHPKVGKECLEAIEARLGKDNFLHMATQICAFHHEKWDGSGYPNGLAGKQIPLEARIVALADVYDALTSRRPYKEPFSHGQAREIIVEGRGSHFDPQVVDAFVVCEERFQSYSESVHHEHARTESTDSIEVLR